MRDCVFIRLCGYVGCDVDKCVATHLSFPFSEAQNLGPPRYVLFDFFMEAGKQFADRLAVDNFVCLASSDFGTSPHYLAGVHIRTSAGVTASIQPGRFRIGGWLWHHE